jgi:hypothetical protein
MTTAAEPTLLLTFGSQDVSFLRHPLSKGRVASIDMYDLATTALPDYKALLLPMHSDQRHLLGCRAQLEEFLRGGGIIVFSGHIAYAFLPELAPFVAADYRSVSDLRVYRMAEHPIWRGVQEEDLTFRKGVAGFYGRGYNPPPPGAHIINTLGPQGFPLDYLYARAGGGTVLIHAGNDFWNFALFPNDSSSAARMPAQLLNWIETHQAGGAA